MLVESFESSDLSPELDLADGRGLLIPDPKPPPAPKPPELFPITPKPEALPDNELKPEAAKALDDVVGSGDLEPEREANGDAADVLAKPLLGGIAVASLPIAVSLAGFLDSLAVVSVAGGAA